MLSGKNILIGISGGIAAYKICQLIRNLVKKGANVKVVMSNNAKEFITPLTLSTLSKNKVYYEEFNQQDWSPEHISLAQEADLLILAPATANTIGKVANGICDNLLTSITCAFTKPILFAPAMNCNMWKNKLVQKNIKTLLENGFQMVEPETGELACGYDGVGRMAELNHLENYIIEVLSQNQFLKNKKIVVTAGGTIEEIDPVRYIGNYSSGKMGIAIADAAYEAGAQVTLISSVQIQRPYKLIVTKSAQEMFCSTKTAMKNSDSLIMAAAVADYKPKEKYIHKIKKTDSLNIELIKNPDILEEIAKNKKNSQIIVGFAAESENLLDYAKSKLKKKNLDFIVANDISKPETGFGAEENEIYIINKNLEAKKIDRNTKKFIAKQLLKEVFDVRN